MAKKAAAERDDAEQPEGETTGAKSQSKMGAVRVALAELGQDAKPPDIVDFAKRRFGVELTAKQASVYKSQLRAKSERQRAEPVEEAAPSAAPIATTDETPLLRQLRDLVGMIGKDGVKKLVDGL